MSDTAHNYGDSDASVDTVTIPRSLADAAIKALRDAKVNAIAFYSDEPYPDDPRWTPWTRFGERLARKCERAEKALKEALADA